MRTFSTIFGVGVAVAAGAVLWTAALDLMSQPNDVAVGVGYGILLVLAGLVVAGAVKLADRLPSGRPPLGVLLLVAVLATGCGYTRIGPGEAGVKVDMVRSRALSSMRDRLMGRFMQPRPSR